ncbi:hypothetical protein FQN51_002936, partial [Onygenales sp. PD_10]
LHQLQELANLEAAELASAKAIKILVAMFVSSVEAYTCKHSLCKPRVACPATQGEKTVALLHQITEQLSEIKELMEEVKRNVENGVNTAKQM